MDKECNRFRDIKQHFNGESREFDSIIRNRIPFYDLFVKALVNALLFKEDESVKVVDLGCGTGTVALKVKEKFPNAKIVCVDFSPEMIASAKEKLGKYTDISYCEQDIFQFDFTDYDAVFSSLCLHHIGSEREKKDFFMKIYEGLSQGGAFYIYDVVLGSSESLQNIYLKEWKKYMREKLSFEEIEETIHKYKQEDRPFPLMNELKWLEETGFKEVDVVCKFYNGAVYGGVKRTNSPVNLSI
jgi:tRNA (cmo5U34)-methyltransferase